MLCKTAQASPSSTHKGSVCVALTWKFFRCVIHGPSVPHRRKGREGFRVPRVSLYLVPLSDGALRPHPKAMKEVCQHSVYLPQKDTHSQSAGNWQVTESYVRRSQTGYQPSDCLWCMEVMRQACCLWASPDSTAAATAAQSEWCSSKHTVNVELTFSNLSHQTLRSGHLENKLARIETI